MPTSAAPFLEDMWTKVKKFSNCQHHEARQKMDISTEAKMEVAVCPHRLLPRLRLPSRGKVRPCLICSALIKQSSRRILLRSTSQFPVFSPPSAFRPSFQSRRRQGPPSPAVHAKSAAHRRLASAHVTRDTHMTYLSIRLSLSDHACSSTSASDVSDFRFQLPIRRHSNCLSK